MAKTVEKPTLLQKTIELLRHRDRTMTLELVSEKCDCSVAFLSSLLSSEPPKRPGVNAVQRLYETLSGQELTY